MSKLPSLLVVALALAIPMTASGQDKPPAAPDVVTSAGQAAPQLMQPLPLPAAVPPPPPPPPPIPQKPVGPRQIKTDSKAPSLAARLSWRWPEFRTYQIGLVIGQVLAAVGSVAIPGGERMRANNGFDDAVRDALRVKIPEGGRYARDASDIGLVLLVNQLFVDNLIVTWWFHDKGSTAWQMTLVDAQTVSFSAAINSVVAGAAGRERPYARGYCTRSPEAESTDCQGNNRYRSFFSGHATAAFTMAALTCVHHAELPLYGGGPGEAVPCATSVALASGVSILRVAADQHYATDVITGAAFGTLSGIAIPYAFHYAWGDAPSDERGAQKPAISVLPTGTGLTVMGAF
ncbi:MAG: phosphatase PAP2 family protein [Myxococcales bacterium]|nr:phosphatase PAP2 family protein [Myxococcales bacterium]